MAKTDKQVVQIEITAGTSHMLTWVDAQLRPKVGMRIELNGDSRTWDVIWAGTLSRGVDSIPPVKVVG